MVWIPKDDRKIVEVSVFLNFLFFGFSTDSGSSLVSRTMTSLSCVAFLCHLPCVVCFEIAAEVSEKRVIVVFVWFCVSWRRRSAWRWFGLL